MFKATLTSTQIQFTENLQSRIFVVSTLPMYFFLTKEFVIFALCIHVNIKKNKQSLIVKVLVIFFKEFINVSKKFTD